MEVVVDGIIYQLQTKGGISRLYHEILPRMCDMDESMQITLLTKGLLRQPIPTHPHIVHRSVPSIDQCFPPIHVFRRKFPRVSQFLRRLWIGCGDNKIWHSTYYTLPESWNGKQVVTVMDMIYERFRDYFNGAGDERLRGRKRNCVLVADAVICISDTTRTELKHFYGINADSKIKVIPLAHSDVFKPLKKTNRRTQIRAAKPFILYVGNRENYKNFSGLLNAYSIWPYRKEIDLVVVGRNWLPHEEKCIAKLRIKNHVHLFEDVDDENLCVLYNQAIAFVYPSLYEGFGIPLLEAMACGCPVVASHIPSTVEIAGDCPIYFNPHQVESLLPALDLVLSEGRDTKRVQMGFKIAGKYSWDETAKQTLNVYHAL